MAHPSNLNRIVADHLADIADVLEQQGANWFRIHAYLAASEFVRKLQKNLGEVVDEEGVRGLVALPSIGRSIAQAIVEIVHTGRCGLLDRLRGDQDPVRLFQAVPGVGPELARRLHDELHIDTLEALEVAAHDGRLESVPGVGDRRAKSIRASLQSMLGQARGRHREGTDALPAVEDLLLIDRQYRVGAKDGSLSTIAPRRFNPAGEVWLPIYHSTRKSWHYTALFSNTARAHRLGRTLDWVVIFFHNQHHEENQCTVVTEFRGPLAGQRVVRGREQECLDHYSHRGAGKPARLQLWEKCMAPASV